MFSPYSRVQKSKTSISFLGYKRYKIMLSHSFFIINPPKNSKPSYRPRYVISKESFHSYFFHSSTGMLSDYSSLKFHVCLHSFLDEFLKNFHRWAIVVVSIWVYSEEDFTIRNYQLFLPFPIIYNLGGQ